MRYSIQGVLLGFIKTLILLVFLEVFTSAVLPAIGINDFKPAFNVLIVLYLAFKVEVPFLPFLILLLQYVHSAFSIEGWASGTIAGIIIAISVKYVKDMLSFTSAVSTIVVVQIFQIAWFVIMATILTLKIGDFSHFFHIFSKYLPESIFLSLISHHFFLLLDRFWRHGKADQGVSI